MVRPVDEGIFAGKGLYDVEAFRRALDERVPRTRSSRTICSKGSTRERRS
jgi:hypothetical protein